MRWITAFCLACLALGACARSPQVKTAARKESPARKLSAAEVRSRIDPLISGLESEGFREREKAQEGLQNLLIDEISSFDAIVAYLKQRLDAAEDAETQERLKRLMESHVMVVSLYRDAELVVLAEVCGAFHDDLWEEGAAIFGNVFRIIAFLKGESPLQIGLVEEERRQGIDGELKKTYYTLPDTKDNLFIVFMNDTDKFRAADNVTVLAPTGEHGVVAGAICKLADLSLEPFFDVPLSVRHAGRLRTFLDKAGDREPNVRLHAVRALGGFRNARVVEPLVKALGDSNPWVRLAAAHSLDTVVGPQQVPVFDTGEEDEWKPEKVAAMALKPLVSLLSDMNYNVRWAAAQALGDTGDARALKLLIGALDDENPTVRLASVIALGKLRDRRIVKAVVSALGDKSAYVRGAVVDILKEKKDPRAVGPLCKLLADTEPWIRCKAALALLSIRDRKAVEPLLKALRDSDRNVRWAAADALGEIGDTKAVEGLIAALGDGYEMVRARAADALGRLAGRTAAKPLIEALSDKNWFVRRDVITALGKIGDARAVKPLVRLLGEEENNELRRRIVEALGAFQVPEAIDTLVGVAKDTVSNSRRRAIEALGRMCNEKAVKALGELLGDPDAYVEYAAADALRYNVHPKALEVLIGALKHKSADVRTAAAESLGKKGDVKAVEPLVGLLGDGEVGSLVADGTPVSGFVADALKEIGQPALPALQEVLERQKDEEIAQKLKAIIETVEKKGK